jgi:hypothetical protein
MESEDEAACVTGRRERWLMMWGMWAVANKDFFIFPLIF